MDSLTQITLGAAVGEVVLGRRAGNRAMLWGAIAGTIPDLDVFANAVTDEISALAYHRAFTHSLAFAALTPLVLGALVHRIYGGKEGPMPASPGWSLGAAWVYLLALIAVGSYLMPIPVYGVGRIALLVSAIIMLFPVFFFLREKWRRRPSQNENPGWLAWSHLFFWSIVTHPLLDACTTYGTQLWQPFSEGRAALNNIAVADPLYTVPFLIFVIWASRISRHSQRRQWVNYAGLAVSCAYMALTFVNKWRVDGVFANSLAEERIVAARYMTSPTILNNLLWTGAAECDTVFYHGQYSLLDDEPRFDLAPIPKGHNLIADHWDDRDVAVLRWFSKGYFNVLPIGKDTLQLNDLRFGGLGSKLEQPDDYIFRFILTQEGAELKAAQNQDGPDISFRDALAGLWRRMMGDKSGY